MNSQLAKKREANLEEKEGSFLSDSKILQLLKDGDLVIHPIVDPTVQISGSKVDLRLDNVFHLVQRTNIQSYDAPGYNEENLPSYLERKIVPYGTHFVLHPGELVLAPTFESIWLPNYLIGFLEGRSSLARLGILVHITAGVIDPGFVGSLIVELLNVGRLPVDLYPLMRIGALSLARVEGEVGKPYTGKYRGFENIEDPSSTLWKDEWPMISSMKEV